MQVLKTGHIYSLENFEPEPEFFSGNHQVLQFIEKEPVPDGLPGELRTVANGTTNEEVLSVLIDRMKYLNDKFSCRENSIVITKLEESLMWLQKRTQDRLMRGVEGRQLP